MSMDTLGQRSLNKVRMEREGGREGGREGKREVGQEGGRASGRAG